ncbi:hypothetical protein HDV00_004020 [Rhizophlyctis rosea]|nr:hypothetical protein HDV00_004020 [Rhizophlyctis rosea]
MSPTSLKIALKQIQFGKGQDFARCFQIERYLAKRMLEIKTDFYEGVKAKLVEKRPAKWMPSWEEMGAMTPEVVNKFFFTIPAGERRELKLLNNTTYYNYPHRTLSGLPTYNDISRVVYGQGQIKRHAPPKTKAELLEWFETYWGGYDETVLNGRTENNIDHGYGRGKTGLREKVITLMDKYVEETELGLVCRIPQ